MARLRVVVIVIGESGIQECSVSGRGLYALSELEQLIEGHSREYFEMPAPGRVEYSNTFIFAYVPGDFVTLGHFFDGCRTHNFTRGAIPCDEVVGC